MKFPQTHIQISHSSLQLFFDLVLLALPVPVILKTKLPKKKRGMLQTLESLEISCRRKLTFTFSRIDFHLLSILFQRGCNRISTGLSCSLQ